MGGGVFFSFVRFFSFSLEVSSLNLIRASLSLSLSLKSSSLSFSFFLSLRASSRQALRRVSPDGPAAAARQRDRGDAGDGQHHQRHQHADRDGASLGQLARRTALASVLGGGVEHPGQERRLQGLPEPLGGRGSGEGLGLDRALGEAAERVDCVSSLGA